MTSSPRIPWGLAKQILVNLAPGQHVIARQPFVPTFRAVAARNQVPIIVRPLWNGPLRYMIKRTA